MKRTRLILVLLLAVMACNLPAQIGTPTAKVPSPASETNLPASTITPSAILPPPTSTPATPLTVCVNEACTVEKIQFNYLIVTRPKFVNALTPFIDWKTENGFRVGLVTVEWLDATYPGRHLAEKMKTGMHDLRKRAGVKYVLLVGDTMMTRGDFSIQNVMSSYDLSLYYNVPTGFYRRVDTDPPGEVLPSDAYFVEDRDWDPENTGVNPRPESGGDTLQADLYLGRWSVREPEQIAVLFEKTQQISIASSIFFAADVTLTDGVTTNCRAWPPEPDDIFSCYLDTMVTGRTQLFEANSPHITTDSMFVDLTDAQQASDFLQKFLASQGVTVASFHGDYGCWQIQPECFQGEDFKFEHVFPLLEVEACLVAAFYAGETPTITEALSQSPTGPIIMTEAPNPVLFLRDLRDGKSVGEALWGSAVTYLYWPNPIILLGDPSLVVFNGP